MTIRNIVKPDEYETLVSSGNKMLVKDFLIEKKAQNRAESTITQYHGDLKIILTMVYRHFDNKLLTDLTRKDIRNLSIVFQDMEMSSARVNRLLSTLRSTLEFCSDDDDYNYDFNVGSKVKGLPRNPVRAITFLSEDQINYLKNTLLEKEEYLMCVYLMLSYFSAARKSEVYQVEKEGLTENFFTNIVVGKRRKKFRLYYNEEVQEVIKLYLDQRGKDTMPQLFVKLYKNGEKRPLNKTAFSYWCEVFSRMLSEHEGKEIKVNPHCFRHSRLENLSKQGVPIERLKTLANHSDISTTASYLAERNEEDIAFIFNMDPKNFVA